MAGNQKIVPCLWFDRQAEEAVDWYTSVFDNSSMDKETHFDAASAQASGQPEGLVLTREFTLEGLQFIALNGGPQFRPNPSVSFIVNCPTVAGVDALWEQLSAGGKVLMPLDTYPFSDRYGWVEDRFGVSWQLIHTDNVPERKIIPSLLFCGDVCGRAEEAMNFYISLFGNSSLGQVFRYGPDQAPDVAGTVMFADFTLAGQGFAAMDSAHAHDFTFDEGISLMVDCQDQEEVDHFWDALTGDGEEVQCGWLRDRYGLCWQIIPSVLPRLLADPDRERASRVMQAMLTMKKLNVEALLSA